MAPSRIRLARFSVASAIATGISQVVLLVVYGWSSLDATTASTIAFLAGSVPHFLMVRYWAWPPGKLHAQLATYLTVTLIGGVASIALTTTAEWMILPFLSAGWQPIALTLSYLAASGPVFLAKFAIFDRVFAARAQRRYALGMAGGPAGGGQPASHLSAGVEGQVRVRAQHFGDRLKVGRSAA